MTQNNQRDTPNDEMQKQKLDFVSFMQESPLVGEDIEVQRLDSSTRGVSL